MSIHRFSHGERFCWNDSTFTVTQLIEIEDGSDNNGPAVYVQYENELGQRETKACSLLEQELYTGHLRFLSHAAPNLSSAAPKQPSYLGKGLDDFDSDMVAVAQWRYSVIAPLIERDRVTTADVEARVQEVKASLTEEQRQLSWYRLSRSTVNTWRKGYRESGGDIRALIPSKAKRGGPGKTRLPATVEAILESVIHDYVLEAELEASLTEVWSEVTLRVKELNAERRQQHLPELAPPGRTTVWEWIDRLKTQRYLADLKDKEAQAPKRHRPKTSRRKLLPTGEIEIDTTEVDLIAVDEDRTVPLGRLNLVCAIDVATGYPFGRYIGFEPESHYTSLECLYHGCLPKPDVQEVYGTRHPWLSQGTPALVRIDRGRGYHNRHVRDASALLSFELDVLPPRTPYLKPFVENTFKQTNEGFHYLDGTTFSNYELIQAFRAYDAIFQKKCRHCYQRFMSKSVNGLSTAIGSTISFSKAHCRIPAMNFSENAVSEHEKRLNHFYAKRGDYDSLKAAVLTCFEVDKLLHQHLLDLVAEQPLRGTRGISRASLWRELTKPPFEFRRPESGRDLLIALGWVDERKIHDYGIVIDYLRYDNKRMGRLQAIWAGQKAKVKYHPGDLSRIYVLDPEAADGEEHYVEIPAVDQEYAEKLSSWQHKVIMAYLKEERGGIDPAQFAETRRVMRIVLEEARQQTKSIRQRQRTERFLSALPSSANVGNTSAPTQPPPEEKWKSFQLSEADLRLDPKEDQQWCLIRPSAPRKFDLDLEDEA